MSNENQGISAIIQVVIGIVIIGVAGAVGLFIMDKVDTATPLVGNGQAHNQFLFTSNSTVGEYINISTGLGSYGQSCFYVNTTAGKPVGCLVINVGANSNATHTRDHFETALAADTDINSLITISHVSASDTTITLIPTGSQYNWAVSETTVNGSWAHPAFTGGSTLAGSKQTLFETVETGFSFIVILLIAVVGAIAIGTISNLMRRKEGE